MSVSGTEGVADPNVASDWCPKEEHELEDARYHDLRRRKEQIVTYVSTSGLQKQSNKAGKGQINNQIIETPYWTFEFAWQNNTNADFPGPWCNER